MKIHTVKKGDTLTKIAKKFQVSVTDIQRVNQLKNLDHLMPGMKIKVPSRKVALPTRQQKVTKEQPTIVDQLEIPAALEQTEAHYSVQPAQFGSDFEAEEFDEVSPITEVEEGETVVTDFPPIGPHAFARTAEVSEDETQREAEIESDIKTNVETEDISFQEFPPTGPTFVEHADLFSEETDTSAPELQPPALEVTANEPEEATTDEESLTPEVYEVDSRDVQPYLADTETDEGEGAVAVYFPPVGPNEKKTEPKQASGGSYSTSSYKTGYRYPSAAPFPYMHMGHSAPFSMHVPMQPMTAIPVPYSIPVTMAPVQPLFVPLTPMYLPPYQVTPHAMFDQENMHFGQFHQPGGVHRDGYMGMAYPGSSYTFQDRYPLEQMARPEVWPSWGSLHDESSASN